MKKLARIVTVEMGILWLLSAATLDSEWYLLSGVILCLSSVWLALVAHATFEWKGGSNARTTDTGDFQSQTGDGDSEPA